MNMQKFTTWGLALGIAGVLLAGPIIDEHTERAGKPARIESTERFERDLRACMQALGPAADLIRIEGTDDYVCREIDIEPTPAHILRRYGELAGRKV